MRSAITSACLPGPAPTTWDDAPVPAVRVISFPFRLDLNGSVATVEQDSDPEIEEQIALAMLTRTGERIQAPTFGVADPAFIGFAAGNLQRHLNDFGPRVEVTAVDISRDVEGRERVVVNWQRRDVTREVPQQ